MADKIYSVRNKSEEKFLRQRAQEFDFGKHGKKEIADLVSRMKKAMREARGIGLSANQIGLSYKVFVAEVPDANGGLKFYSVFNPVIEKKSSETISFEEGCLSIPNLYGRVPRSERVVLEGSDKNGRPLKIKAWGLLARVFQHEIDHLEGKVFTDRTKEIYSSPSSERIKQKTQNHSS
ncbi:peptide deformylase [Candidatus Parcubacteria bacterium]|nr:MAG: peptide deformylase [Candidatus Parcubacteria bacterium]